MLNDPVMLRAAFLLQDLQTDNKELRASLAELEHRTHQLGNAGRELQEMRVRHEQLQKVHTSTSQELSHLSRVHNELQARFCTDGRRRLSREKDIRRNGIT